MAVRRMNEFWKTMGLALMFGFLLLHSCQGQDPADQSANPSTGPSTGPSTNPEKIGATNPTGTPTAAPTAATTANSAAADSTPGPAADPTSGPAILETTDTRKLGSFDTTGKAANTADASQLTSVPGPSETTDTINSDVKLMMNPLSNQGSQITPNQKQEEKGSSPAVFVSVLVAGLLLAAIIVGIYYFKCHRRTNGKGMKLAEESYMADEENQGNTLVSVAPLNQPEPQEKPSLNGESQEAVKAQTPPAATNGHSTTKTADTEL
ncbi:uncharacterized protein cd34 [Onychostoma macrolepis]|uniref:Uncharacterized protein n=1 Tax=Onychostoma macrolepis TaxID=369639 RepID=A0A7J6BND4_9TELE|nr:uncharacterized protein cd34 [Onychostoma macrolepis]KAF4096504.1 hypothetical protein G5714_022473 [Onychostoma macrolepis]